MSEHITGSQHDYEPVAVDDPNTYSMALLWANAYTAQDPESQQLREQLEQQYRDAEIEEVE